MAMLMACPAFLKGNIVIAIMQGYTCLHFHVKDASIAPVCRDSGAGLKMMLMMLYPLLLDKFKQQAKMWMKKEALLSKYKRVLLLGCLSTHLSSSKRSNVRTQILPN